MENVSEQSVASVEKVDISDDLITQKLRGHEDYKLITEPRPVYKDRGDDEYYKDRRRWGERNKLQLNHNSSLRKRIYLEYLKQ